MLRFTFIQKTGTNFVPANKIKEWAEKNGHKTFYSYDTLFVTVQPYGNYSYSHYRIRSIGEDHEEVEISLALKEKFD